MAQFCDYWSKMTSDYVILDMVREGVKIEFDQTPWQNIAPKPYVFNMRKKQMIDHKIEQYILKGIVEEAQFEEGQFISNIFAEPKSDGDIRIILDLTELNKYVTDRHFKMENIEVVKNLIRPGCYMASIDWKDAYYSVKIQEKDRKYL